jgi:hypothetical protein
MSPEKKTRITKTPIEKVNDVCKKIVKIKDSDIDECIQMARQQSEYTHALKNGTAVRIQKIGSNNIRILRALKNLRNAILDNASV